MFSHLKRDVLQELAHIIGRDIPLKLIEKKACRIKKFTALASMKNGKIIEENKHLPYAFLSLASLELPEIRYLSNN